MSLQSLTAFDPLVTSVAFTKNNNGFENYHHPCFGTFSTNFYGLHVWDTRRRVPCIPRGLLFSWNLYGLILYFKVHWWSWKQNPKREFRSKIAYFWKMCNFWCSILWNISWWVSMKSFDWSIMTLRSTDFLFWLCSVWQLWNLFLKHEIAKVSLVSGSKTGSKTAKNEKTILT